MDNTWDSLEKLLASRRRTIVDMLTMTGGGGDFEVEQRGTLTDVYKLLSDLYMQTCSVKVGLSSFYGISTMLLCHFTSIKRLFAKSH